MAEGSMGSFGSQRANESGERANVKSNSLNLPNWVVTVLQMTASAGVAIVLMYAKVSTHETQLNSVASKQDSIQSKVSEHDALFKIMENSKSMSDKNVTDSLRRIEEQVKELREEFKDMKKRTP